MLSTIQTELLELIRKAQSYRELLKLTEARPELRALFSASNLPTENFDKLWRLVKHGG